jgi:hypothetical protein
MYDTHPHTSHTGSVHQITNICDNINQMEEETATVINICQELLAIVMD